MNLLFSSNWWSLFYVMNIYNVLMSKNLCLYSTQLHEFVYGFVFKFINSTLIRTSTNTQAHSVASICSLNALWTTKSFKFNWQETAAAARPAYALPVQPSHKRVINSNYHLFKFIYFHWIWIGGVIWSKCFNGTRCTYVWQCETLLFRER